MSTTVPIVSVTSAPVRPIQIDTPDRQPCVFLDRDGVFNSTDGFVNTPADLDRQLWPAALGAIARLTKETSARVVLVTNQGGVGSGKMSEETNHAILERFAQRIGEAGGRMDAIYYCPTAPRAAPPAEGVDARKPAPGMILQAAQDFGTQVDLADSYMIGDMTTDIAAGEAASPRVTTVLVQTGFGGKDGKVKATPDHVSTDLADAVEWIIGREKTS